ncbi:TPA: hypothetical protein N0F65_000383 [Lagenidium giganteum]|uniref:Tetraspanin n=1 Tax=Lagenidium giganteum TaxID=4803 RepID=A0AAV2Z2W4_9STRA|nr:TPA: hypothetical protein N0F65_000383 [Lagenidium giganteum]
MTEDNTKRDEEVSLARLMDKYHREALFSAACGLVCFGTIPFWGVLKLMSSRQDMFDHVTMAIAAIFTAFGVAIVVFSCLAIPPRATELVIQALKLPLGMVTAVAMVMIYSYCTSGEIAAVWRASTLPGMDSKSEAAFARRINHVLCVELGDQVCRGTVAEAAELFQLVDGPSPDIPVRKACEGVDVWDNAHAHDVCHACHVTIHQHVDDNDAIALQSAVKSYGRQQQHWCGNYLINGNVSERTFDSPYYQHRFELLQFWETMEPCTLLIGSQLLGILSCCSAAIVAILQWWQRNEANVHAADEAALVLNNA